MGFEMGGEGRKQGLLQMGNFCLAVMRMHNNTNKLDGVGHGSAFIQKLETERKKKTPHNIFLPFSCDSLISVSRYTRKRNVFIKCLSAHVSFLFHFSFFSPNRA